jgi:uncharacterized Zn ribbon protein
MIKKNWVIFYKDEVGDCPECLESDFKYENLNDYTCLKCWFKWKSTDFFRGEEDI